MTSDSQLPLAVEFLLTPEAYPHPVETVELRQTHISFVLLSGDFVYKLKKPVDFGFLDFSTLELRKKFCHEELRLNQRLCPEIYLSVSLLARQADGSFVLLPDEQSLEEEMVVMDYLVRMRRMPESGMMPRLISAGELCERHLDAITDKLLPFYEQAAADEEVRSLGSVAAVSVNVLENFSQTEEFVGGAALSRSQFERISEYSKAFLANSELFDARIAAGHIRECHGDLYSANICFGPESVYIFDCIEFNRRFRCSDIASDIAFLVMDLDFHGLPELSRYFVEQFVSRSGDEQLLSLLPFYCSYRAYVRGKIGLFTANSAVLSDEERAATIKTAGEYFKLAESYVG